MNFRFSELPICNFIFYLLMYCRITYLYNTQIIVKLILQDNPKDLLEFTG